MNDLPLFRTYRDKEGLHIVPRKPARGRQTLPKESSHAPSGNINAPRSYQATLLYNAMRGDERAELRLVEKITENIKGIANSENWGLRGDLSGLAVIALRPYIYQEELGQQAAADECKISRGTYRRNWKNEKLAEVRKWVKTIHSELN